MMKREFAEWISEQLENSSEKGRYMLFVETEATADDPDQEPDVLVTARASKGFVTSSILTAFERLKNPVAQLEIIALLAAHMSGEANKAQKGVEKLVSTLFKKLDESKKDEKEEAHERKCN